MRWPSSMTQACMKKIFCVRMSCLATRSLAFHKYTRQSFRLRIHTSNSIGHEWRYLHTRLPPEPSALIPQSCALDPHSFSNIAFPVLDISSPISVGPHQHRTQRSTSCRRHVQRATLNCVTQWIPNQIPQHSLDVGLVANGGCSDVRRKLTHRVLDVWTIRPEQPGAH